MKTLVRCLCSLALCCQAAAATYYVATTGNNGNPGTFAQPWLTVQYAANTVVAGDTVIVQAGTYAERVTESTSGTLGNPITYTTNGVVNIGGFTLTGAHVTVNGFNLTGSGGGGAFVLVQAHNARLLNLTVDRPAHSAVMGVRVWYGGVATNCWMENIRLTNLWYPNFMLSSDHGTVTNCHIVSTTSWDAFRILASNNRIVGNHVTMTHGTSEEHADLIQAYTSPGEYITNNVIEGNLFGPFDMQVQMSMIDDDTTGHCADWTWRNNIFIGPSAAMHVQVPNFKFYNNTFYRMFTDSGLTLSGDPGWAYANNTIFRNNLWVQCGEDSSDPYVGWYSIGGGVTGTDSDYNLVIGTGAGTTKTGFVSGGREAHSLNGVNPLLVSPGSSLASGYALQAASPALNVGTTIATFAYDYAGTIRPHGAAWDMGAYEYASGAPPPTEYYIATTGSDVTGNGSSGNPWASLGHAVTQARGTGVDLILMRSGTYYLTDVILTNADSGLTITADTGSTPILSGGTNLATWTTNGSYQEATLPTFPASVTSMSSWRVRELLVDNARLQWARLPTDGSWLNHLTTDTSDTAMTYSGSDVPSGLVIANAELETRWIWDANILPIISHYLAGRVLTVSPAATRNFGHWGETRYAIRNTVDGMLTGRWYHDRVGGRIIVQTNTLAGMTVVVPAASSVIRLMGTSHAAPLTGVTLSGLTIRCTTVPDLADAFGGVHYPGAIHGDNTSGITVTNCTVEHVGGAGISFTFLNDNLGCNIVNNTVRDTGGSGIMFSDGTVSGNTVTDAGVQYLSGAGIYYNANGQTGAGVSYITTNTVDSVQGSGIVAGLGVTGSAIRHNTVTDAEQSMNDGGWIYMTTMTGFIGFNRLYGTAYATTVDRYGIYLDDTATSCRAVSNATFNVSVPLLVHASSNCSITNNYFTATSGNMRGRFSAISGGTTVCTRNIWDYPGSFLAVGDAGDQPSWAGNLIWSPAGNTGVPAAATYANPIFTTGYMLATDSPAHAMGILPLFGISAPKNLRVTTVNAGSVTTP